MAASFFKALNPESKNSGIAYPTYVVDKEKLGQEIIDNTVSENIREHKEASSFYQVFEILVGKHYTFGYLQVTSKGILDYLIFPLISRALLNEFDHNVLINILACSIALPLEIARFGLGIVLTLLIAPVVALVNLFKSDMPTEEQHIKHDLSL